MVQEPQYWGRGGDCSLLFGWPEVDKDLVLEWGDLWLLVFTGESYGCVPVLMLQQEGQLQIEPHKYLFINITTCACKYYRFWHVVKFKTLSKLGVRSHSTGAKCTYKTHKYFLMHWINLKCYLDIFIWILRFNLHKKSHFVGLSVSYDTGTETNKSLKTL